MKTTKEIAVILGKRDPVKYQAIIKRAYLNGYHDFKFDQIPDHPEFNDTICPKLKLVDDLSQFPELNDVRQRVMEGDFDESPDDLDNLIIKGMLINADCPDKLFEVLGLSVPTEEDRLKWTCSKQDN